MAQRSEKKDRSEGGGDEEKNAASGAVGSGGEDRTLPGVGSNNGGATTADFASAEGMRSLGGAGENTAADQVVASDCDSDGEGSDGGAVPCGASPAVAESAIPLPGLAADLESVAVAQNRDASPPAEGLAGGSEAATAATGVSEEDLDISMVDEMDAWIADDDDSNVLRAEGSGPLDPPEENEKEDDDDDDAVAREGGGHMAPEATEGSGTADATPPSSPPAAATLADDDEQGVGETPNPTAVLREEARVVEMAASSGAEVEIPPRVEVLPAVETAREMAGEARVQQEEESVERPGTAHSLTEAPPPLDTGLEHDPSAIAEVRLGAGADGVPTDGEPAGAAPLTTTPVLEAGLGRNAEEDAVLAAVRKPVLEDPTPVVERVDEAVTETLAAAPPTSATAVAPVATAALAASSSAAAASPMLPASPSEPSDIAATDDSAALRVAEPGSPEGRSEPSPRPVFASVRHDEATLTVPASPTTLADNSKSTAACPKQDVEVLVQESALAAVAEGAASQTPPPPPPLKSATGGGSSGREKATAAKAAAASARAAALVASAEAASAGRCSF